VVDARFAAHVDLFAANAREERRRLFMVGVKVCEQLAELLEWLTACWAQVFVLDVFVVQNMRS
jgi:hypothetical protein